MDYGLKVQSSFNSNNIIINYSDYNPVGMNILVIDENVFTISFLETFLTNMNYNVYTAASGFEGLELFKSIPNIMSIVVIDLFVSGMDGLTIYSIFKTLNPEIKIIMLVNQSIDVSFLLNLDIDTILEKPIDFSKMDSILRAMR